MKLAELGERFLAVFFPCRCVLCGEVVAYDDLCCEKCALKDAGIIEEIPAPLDGALCGLAYDGGVRKAVLRIKKKPDRRGLEFFADIMYKKINPAWDGIDFDVLVPVPASDAALSKKGFNQAEKLAFGLGALMDLPVLSNTLSRSDNSLSQHSLNSRERLINAQKSYAIKEGGLVSGKTVLLVDDVFTTGATLSVCAERLKESGAKAVYAVAAARTELQSKKI